MSCLEFEADIMVGPYNEGTPS